MQWNNPKVNLYILYTIFTVVRDNGDGDLHEDVGVARDDTVVEGSPAGHGGHCAVVLLLHVGEERGLHPLVELQGLGQLQDADVVFDVDAVIDLMDDVLGDVADLRRRNGTAGDVLKSFSECFAVPVLFPRPGSSCVPLP